MSVQVNCKKKSGTNDGVVCCELLGELYSWDVVSHSLFILFRLLKSSNLNLIAVETKSFQKDFKFFPERFCKLKLYIRIIVNILDALWRLSFNAWHFFLTNYPNSSNSILILKYFKFIRKRLIKALNRRTI